MTSFKTIIEDHLKQRLSKTLPGHSTDDIYHYAIFPCGKLIRSQLTLALGKDLKGNFNANQLQVATFLEFHHAYTLIHDDLPSMDNDDFRRGKPSTHKAYNEWKALLAGDGLLVLSFAELTEINSFYLKQIFRFAAAYTGPRGLIWGQILDLNQEMNHSIKSLIKTHQLKTARLFQLSFILSYFSSLEKNESPLLKDLFFYHKLGDDLGVLFQLLDDLIDLTGSEISPHELSINPFLVHPEKSTELLQKRLNSLSVRLNSKKFPMVKQVLSENYFSKTIAELKKNEAILNSRIKNYLPIKLVLNSFQL